jgi:tetratricopeptide (TPR) repeat protein
MSRFPILRRSLRLAFLLFASTAVVIPAFAQGSSAPKKELSDKVSEELGKIRTQTDAKNYDAAVAIIDNLLRGAAPGSYDIAVLSQVKAQILLTKGDYAKSIEPLETALKLSEQSGYFDQRVNQDLRYYLAQLYYQEAANSKVAAQQKPLFAKASAYIERWSKENTKPNPDAQLFYASVLYNQAQLDPNSIDTTLIRRAQQEVERGLLMSLKPKDTFYILLLATLQQQNEMAKSAEILELLVKMTPTNKTYWQQLASTYLNLQMDLRAALTIERAQVHGAMNTPKDNFNLVGIYFNMQNYDQAISLLVKGLRDGSIENDIRNWELLGASMLQVNRQQEAIDVYKEASKRFPEAGQLNVQIAQIYYSMDKLNDAYDQSRIAVGKKLEKPWQAQIFLAYVCFELKKLDEALAAIDLAMKHEEGKKDGARLRTAIEDAMKEREAFLNSGAAL